MANRFLRLGLPFGLLLFAGVFKSAIIAESYTLTTQAAQLRRLRNYDITIPRRLEGRQRRDLNTLTEDGHIREPSFVVQIGGEELILDLYLNDVLFADGFLERSYSDFHGPIDTPPNRRHHCYYQGHVRGYNSSRVALSTCNGLRGLIFLDRAVYYIDPLRESDHEHLVYRSSDVIRDKPLYTCAGDYPPKFFQDGEERLQRLEQQQKPGRSKRSVHSEVKYIELVLVADKKTFDLEGSIAAVNDKCKQIANIMDIIYTPLNVRVALAKVEVWNRADEIEVVTNPSMTLGRFQNWRKANLVSSISHDNAQLLTSINFDGATVGMAGVSTMCAPDDSCGVSQNHGNHAADAASTMAHEMGHNLGLVHDDEDKCDCDAAPNVGCVMSAVSGSNPPYNWSSCSVERLSDNLEKGLGACMFNYPRTIFQGPICQNGFLEEGEECDCGAPEYCDNPCCVPETCTLHENATCAIGECCENCQLKPAGIVCRELINECDLHEYCTGIHENCPSNVYRQNGVTCIHAAGDLASCYDGQCLSYDDQCLSLWGPGSRRSHDDCYAYNRQGNDFGNCGLDSGGNRVKCAQQDRFCGKLFCEGGASYPVLGQLARASVGAINGHQCKMATVDQGGDVPDAGYVAEGSPCADEMICYEYHCVNHTMAGIHPCKEDCNDRGVCNSNNNCHCDDEWSPPYCRNPGTGGSIDSGPAGESNYDGGTPGSSALLMIILLVVLIPLFVIGTIVAIWKRDLIKEKVMALRGEPRRQPQAANKGRYAQVQKPRPPAAPAGYIYRPKVPPPPKPTNHSRGAPRANAVSTGNIADKYRWPDEIDTTSAPTPARVAPTPARAAPARPAPKKYTPWGADPEVAVIQPSWKSQPLKPVGGTTPKPATPAKPTPAAAQRAALKLLGPKPTVPRRPDSSYNNNWNNSKPTPPNNKPTRPPPPKK